MQHLLTVWSTVLCLLLLPGSLSRWALNAQEHLRAEWIEIWLLCLPKQVGHMWSWKRPIKAYFQASLLEKVDSPSLVCLPLLGDTASPLLQRSCLLSVGAAHEHLWLLFQALIAFPAISGKQSPHAFFSHSYVTHMQHHCVCMLVVWVGMHSGCRWGHRILKGHCFDESASLWQNVTVTQGV